MELCGCVQFAPATINTPQKQQQLQRGSVRNTPEPEPETGRLSSSVAKSVRLSWARKNGTHTHTQHSNANFYAKVGERSRFQSLPLGNRSPPILPQSDRSACAHSCSYVNISGYIIEIITISRSSSSGSRRHRRRRRRHRPTVKTITAESRVRWLFRV